MLTEEELYTIGDDIGIEFSRKNINSLINIQNLTEDDIYSAYNELMDEENRAGYGMSIYDITDDMIANKIKQKFSSALQSNVNKPTMGGHKYRSKKYGRRRRFSKKRRSSKKRCMSLKNKRH
jgi:hypothetical protein